MLHELERQTADPLAAEWEIDDGVWPATNVDGCGRDRFVHRDGALAEALDAGPIAERLGEGGAQDQCHVLDSVVLVDLEIAIRADREIEQAVMGERAQEVVVV
jgi:hypothetical protein